ncbi:hypothetical protein RI578_41930 (plasmid) [Streptomyces sp. BB1-1-1]|uniref:hypothetical protein n=1 Tax=Streptomyces sp. BB1-1-1 TaxID=3074430 RepID=UPI0028774B0B|nr:hypothetical protein [Streptomyces sp. BB1-1-1]WND32915.1 hypothetical protein RI578_00700 [Streptomyces sp. BB1-1-1]WND40016.1 hypothetical protein RI578_39705 [Streptomyces sp. BB1-1-1]WND40850.1 hypothetical protein RI578_41930 [Streptomyces sp. BB1-1-1]
MALLTGASSGLVPALTIEILILVLLLLVAVPAVWSRNPERRAASKEVLSSLLGR